jgi:DNA-binding transcriptional MerR regulator
MDVGRDELRFNVKAVVRQTGLKPDTLRAWERRYGLPSPGRSAGRHRLYSQRDVEVLRWLAARQQEGLSISRAVDLWRQLDADGRDPLLDWAPVPPPPSPLGEPAPMGGTLDQLREEWLAACLDYDEQRAEQVVTQACALYPIETVCLELLQGALSQVGDLWYRGTATVQQEHFASEMALRRLESLLMATPAPTRPGQVLAACPAQEHHVFGLLLLALLLRRRGWAVLYLGANVPIERLEATVSAVGPDLVVLAALRMPSAATLLEAAQVVSRQAPVGYGGAVFNSLPAIRSRIPGHFLGESVEYASRSAHALLSAPRRVPAGEPIPAQARTALDHFRDRRRYIEAQAGQAAGALGLCPSHLDRAGGELGQHIEAALSLGDLALLGSDPLTVGRQIGTHEVPAGELAHYLSAYRQAASEQMDERGAPVVAWLENVAGGA